MNIRDIIEDDLARLNNKDYIFEKVNGEYKPIKFNDFVAKSKAFATFLVENGFKNETVILIGKNSINLMIADVAVTFYTGVCASMAFGVTADDIKDAAESLGADIVINSTHKTLLSFTGSGILNICSDSVDINAVSEALRMVQTTSPSYLLMASLDINEKIMRKKWRDITGAWIEDLRGFYKGASRINGLTIVTGSGAKGSGSQDEDVFALYRYREGPDPTKINISMSELGLSGERLDKELRYRGIISEMVHGEYVLLMTGAGNTRSDYEKLLDALEDIASGYGVGVPVDRTPRSFEDIKLAYADVPVEGEYVPLYEAVGRVLYDPIVTYPPGTPIACPGEVLTMEVISHISDILEDGEFITGVDDEGMIKVGTGY